MLSSQRAEIQSTIVLVNNGSEDDTGAIIDGLAIANRSRPSTCDRTTGTVAASWLDCPPGEHRAAGDDRLVLG